MKKKIIILFITCFICLFTVSDVGTMDIGFVFVAVKDRYYNPITWAYVSVDNMTCRSIGYGYYRGITWPGWHPVFVWGKVYWVYVKPGSYAYVNAYL